MRFLSDEWFEAARRGLDEIALDGSPSCRLNFTADTTRWHLEIESGRVVAFDAGHIDEPEAEVRWPLADAHAIVSRRLRGNDALRRTTVVAEMKDGRYAGPPAPYNLRRRAELDELPVVPGATLTVQYVYRGGPFGDVDYSLTFADGRLEDESLAVVADHTVTVDVSYRAMALVRAGEITILDALESGSVDGPVGALAVLAGLSEDPRFHAAELATGRHAIALAALGDLDCNEQYAKLMAELASAIEA